MKKLLLILIVMGLAVATTNAAKLKNKQVVGNWKYTVETSNGNLTGIIKLAEVDKKLAGEVNDDQGNIFKLTRVAIENDELLFELQPDNDLIKAKVKLADAKLIGTVTFGNSEELKLVAEKQ